MSDKKWVMELSTEEYKAVIEARDAKKAYSFEHGDKHLLDKKAHLMEQVAKAEKAMYEGLSATLDGVQTSDKHLLDKTYGKSPFNTQATTATAHTEPYLSDVPTNTFTNLERKHVEREQWRRDFAGKLLAEAIKDKQLSASDPEIMRSYTECAVYWTDLLLEALEAKK